MCSTDPAAPDEIPGADPFCAADRGEVDRGRAGPVVTDTIARGVGGSTGPRHARQRRPAWQPKKRGPARWAPALATLVAVGTVIGVTLWQLHLGLLLTNTTTTGGDTGAHFMLPAYIRSNLLPHGSLTGWDPAWYDGFPLYTYYFVLPDLLVALGSYVIPYGVAFKLATVAGSIALPVVAWACGRLFRLRPPVPAALAAATLPFLFEQSFTIYGGTCSPRWPASTRTRSALPWPCSSSG